MGLHKKLSGKGEISKYAVRGKMELGEVNQMNL